MPFIAHLESDISPLLPYSLGHRDKLQYIVGGAYTKVCIPRGENHWGPTWRLASHYYGYNIHTEL